MSGEKIESAADSSENPGGQLSEVAAASLAALRERAPLLASAAESAAGETGLAHVLAASEFIAGRLLTSSELLAGWFAEGYFERARRPAEALEFCETACHGLSGDVLKSKLRSLRQAEFVRILWRDLLGLADLEETLGELSDFADAAIVLAIVAAGRSLHDRHGRLRDENGEPVELRALAMGKLGGRELNFSSDIDLIFIHRGDRDSDGPKPLAAEEYLTRQARRAIAILNDVTADGFVFRVDVRLRPFGDSGALVVSIDALENYLAQHGRDWERYAYVKARLVGPDTGKDSEMVDAVLRPFVYRRYIDFGVFESLRDMKGLIEAEVSRRDMSDNIKLGPGGIREIEFIVQSLQLVRGGSCPSLQERSLRIALKALVRERQIEAGYADELANAYAFLRRLENRIQGIRDQQVHSLPQSEMDRARTVLAMNVADWKALDKAIETHRQIVQEHFSATVFRTTDGDSSAAVEREIDLWAADAEQIATHLQLNDIAEGPELTTAIAEYRGRLHTKPLDETSRRRADVLLPLVIDSVQSMERPATTFRRLCRVVDAILRRSAYISLLIENPHARARFVELAGSSEYLATELSDHPVLLDELLDSRLYDDSYVAVDLDEELDVRLGQIESADIEGKIEALARFKRVASFRVAVADCSGVSTLMKVSDQLTAIAERIIAAALDLAWGEAIERYGVPRCRADGESRAAGFAVVGYGKLGGLELGYGSDLDIVFLHDSEGEQRQTDGAKVLANEVFFIRLARRLVHFLTVQTTSGQLYEVDTRLRPSGRSGLLVSSMSAFQRYQREDAWTWEHQALLRSRGVAGPVEVQTRFEICRREVLAGYIRRDPLKEEVRKMRRRMRSELSKAGEGEFDIKQDVGGLADIEFLVQYLVLANAPEHRDLIHYSDNIRQLDALRAAGLVAADVTDDLQTIYLAYRACIHRRVLDGKGGVIRDGEFAHERTRVRSCWQGVFGTSA